MGNIVHKDCDTDTVISKMLEIFSGENSPKHKAAEDDFDVIARNRKRQPGRKIEIDNLYQVICDVQDIPDDIFLSWLLKAPKAVHAAVKSLLKLWGDMDTNGDIGDAGDMKILCYERCRPRFMYHAPKSDTRSKKTKYSANQEISKGRDGDSDCEPLDVRILCYDRHFKPPIGSNNLTLQYNTDTCSWPNREESKSRDELEASDCDTMDVRMQCYDRRDNCLKIPMEQYPFIVQDTGIMSKDNEQPKVTLVGDIDTFGNTCLQ